MNRNCPGSVPGAGPIGGQPTAGMSTRCAAQSTDHGCGAMMRNGCCVPVWLIDAPQPPWTIRLQRWKTLRSQSRLRAYSCVADAGRCEPEHGPGTGMRVCASIPGQPDCIRGPHRETGLRRPATDGDGRCRHCRPTRPGLSGTPCRCGGCACSPSRFIVCRSGATRGRNGWHRPSRCQRSRGWES